MSTEGFNWLDLVLVLALGMAAVRGYQRGFIVEICSLIALWLGAFAALHFSDRVAIWMGFEAQGTILPFLITFLGVLLLVHLLARALTTLIELALLGLANKIAGIVVALVRSAFVISIMLNILIAYTQNSFPPQALREGSALHDPIQSFAPVVLPRLGESKWLKEMIEQLKRDVDQVRSAGSADS